MAQATPPGINPIDYINYLARLQAFQQQQSGGGGGGNPYGNQQFQLLLNLLNDAQTKYNDARTANEVRRNEILKGRTDTRNRILDQWNQFGDSLINDTNKGYKKNLNDSMAALSQSGLLNSTVNSSIRARNETERQDAMRRVKDQIIGNYAGADERLSNNIDDFQERITDAYPDTSQINSLAQQAGAIIPSAGSAYRSVGGGVGYPGRPVMPTPGGSGGVYGGGVRPLGPGMGGIGGGGHAAQPVMQPPKLTAAPAPPPSLQQLRQADSAAVAGNPQLPWQMGHASEIGGVGTPTPMKQVGNQLIPLYQSMPALGLFGAVPQMGYTETYGGSGYGGGGGGGGYQRVPLWMRDPSFAARIQREVIGPRQRAQQALNAQPPISTVAKKKTSVARPNPVDWMGPAYAYGIA